MGRTVSGVPLSAWHRQGVRVHVCGTPAARSGYRVPGWYTAFTQRPVAAVVAYPRRCWDAAAGAAGRSKGGRRAGVGGLERPRCSARPKGAVAWGRRARARGAARSLFMGACRLTGCHNTAAQSACVLGGAATD